MVDQLADEPRGLILVTGPTGSGKTTTLAAMIDHINSTRPCNIVTIEDPIEVLHTDKLAIVNQREIGTDTTDYAQAMRRVLRQDPDVILIGEMRDPETVWAALSAAETGHLVLSTLHTSNATETDQPHRGLLPAVPAPADPADPRLVPQGRDQPAAARAGRRGAAGCRPSRSWS